jgi:hypothetical protein
VGFKWFVKKEIIKWDDFFKNDESKVKMKIQTPLPNMANGLIFVPGIEDFQLWGLCAVVALTPFLLFKGLEAMNLMNEKVYKIYMGIFRVLMALLPISAIIYLASKTMEAFL